MSREICGSRIIFAKLGSRAWPLDTCQELPFNFVPSGFLLGVWLFWPGQRPVYWLTGSRMLRLSHSRAGVWVWLDARHSLICPDKWSVPENGVGTQLCCDHS